MKSTIIPLMFLCLLMTSCKTTNLFVDDKARSNTEALSPVFFPDANYEYHIRKDDKISISVWGQDELSVGSTYGIYNSNEVYGKWLMVDALGNIEVPKLGTMQVEKMTIIQLKTLLKEQFGIWVKNPIVDIKVLNREITMLGEIRNPQVFTVDKERNTLIDLIARCNGLEFYANAKTIKVLRQVGPDVHVANIDLTEKGNYHLKNINLFPGDVVIVPSKKNKEFERRISTIIPFTTTISAAAILMGAF